MIRGGRGALASGRCPLCLIHECIVLGAFLERWVELQNTIGVTNNPLSSSLIIYIVYSNCFAILATTRWQSAS